MLFSSASFKELQRKQNYFQVLSSRIVIVWMIPSTLFMSIIIFIWTNITRLHHGLLHLLEGNSNAPQCLDFFTHSIVVRWPVRNKSSSFISISLRSGLYRFGAQVFVESCSEGICLQTLLLLFKTLNIRTLCFTSHASDSLVGIF